MRLRIPGAVVAASLFVLPAIALAHGGEDHGAPPVADTVSLAKAGGYGAEGAVFQVVITPAEGGSVIHLALTDTNEPVAGATIEIDAGTWQGQAKATADAGVYGVPWAPTDDGADVSVVVDAGGRSDFLLVPAVGKHTGIAAHPTTRGPVWGWWVAAGSVAAALVIAGFFFRRRRARNLTRSAAILIGAVALTNPAMAHGDHDHGGEEAPTARTGTRVVMPKATQFMLGIRTVKIEAREAADAIRVVGKVTPDPGGYAKVQASQVARVVADPSFPLPVTGQAVRRGQVLVVLEPTLTSFERSDKRAALYRIEGDIVLAERELGRLESLGAYVAAKQLEGARIRLQQLSREKAQIAGTALGRDMVVAPIDGIVKDVHVVPGEVVTPDRLLIEIVDPARLRVEAVIHDLAAAERIAGATAASKLLPERVFTLKLLGVSPGIDAQDQGVHAIFAVTDEQVRRLKINMPVDVFVETGATRLRMAVPRDALVEIGGRQAVFVRTAPEVFDVRPVKVDRVVGNLAEISDGAQPGDKVVIQGIEQLKGAR
jgi:RND family efflux transporter MFP subunit